MFFRAGVTNNGFYFQEINAWAENTEKDPFFFFFLFLKIILQRTIICKFGSTVKWYGQRCKLSIQVDSDFLGESVHYAESN